MRVISRRPLVDFWEKHADAQHPLKSWFQITKKAVWQTSHDIKATFKSVSIIANNRAIFNIGGNKYSLIVAINYDYQIVYVRFVGTHSEYDQVDAAEV